MERTLIPSNVAPPFSLSNDKEVFNANQIKANRLTIKLPLWLMLLAGIPSHPLVVDDYSSVLGHCMRLVKFQTFKFAQVHLPAR